MTELKNIAAVPMSTVGPVNITGPEINAEVTVPLATYETTLLPSTNRGAKLSREAGAINSIIIDERMTRSVVIVNLQIKCRKILLIKWRKKS